MNVLGIFPSFIFVFSARHGFSAFGGWRLSPTSARGTWAFFFIQFLGCIFLVFFLSEVRWQKARSTGSKFPCVRNYNVGKKLETSEGTLVVFPSLFEKTLI